METYDMREKEKTVVVHMKGKQKNISAYRTSISELAKKHNLEINIW
jgi:hypothetical protein